MSAKSYEDKCPRCGAVISGDEAAVKAAIAEHVKNKHGKAKK